VNSLFFYDEIFRLVPPHGFTL